MFKSRRKLFSQIFLHDRELVKRLVRNSSVGKNDIVVEIGAGKGIITEQLQQKALRVIALEIDPYYFNQLEVKYSHYHNLTLLNFDVLKYSFPTKPFKVFANTPFYLEGKLVRKLLCNFYLEDCYMVVRKEAALRWAGYFGNNMFQIMYSPWFDFAIYHRFEETDFLPKTKVEAVMMRIKRKNYFLLLLFCQDDYQKFIKQSFENWRSKLSPARFSVNQWVSFYSKKMNINR